MESRVLNGPLKVPDPSQDGALPKDALKRYVDQIHLWMGIAATVVLAPFAIFNAFAGRPLLSAAIVGIASLFGANLVAVLRAKEPPVSVIVIHLVATGSITFSTFQFQTLYGVLWAYPAAVLFHFMAGARLANVLNAILAGVATALTWSVADAPTALRLCATLLLTIAFANIFSRALESSNRALDEARALAERASLAKSQFLANMSHELRTPLNAIIGYTELLHEDAEAEERTEAVGDLDRITAASRHLLAMIDEILDLARIEANRIQLSVAAIDVPVLIRELQDAVRPLAKANGNEFAIDLAGEAASLALRADATRLRQCLLNLLSNACKFTEDGHIQLRVAAASCEGRPGIRFVVRDTGIGMSREQLRRVFLPFEQADASTTRRFGGTGLGLAITHQLCGLMGGELTASSEPGRGSTFTLVLPLSQVEDAA